MTVEKLEPTADPKELARRLLVSASLFAAEALKVHIASYPGQAATLAQSGEGFAVRISEILSEHPRVSLVNAIDGKEIEVAHVVLHRPATLDPLAMH